MLRQLRILACRNSSKWFSVKHLCTNSDEAKFITKPDDSTKKIWEMNFVKLIGTAWDDSVCLPGGEIRCNVVQRYYNRYNQQCTMGHVLMVSQELFELNNINSLKKGQSFDLNGYIRSSLFETSSGKIRSSISIVPFDFRMFQNDEKPHEDVCIVMMTARIASNIWETNTVMMFDLETHTPVRDEETGFTGETYQRMHVVSVIDSQLQNYIRYNFKRGEYIHVKGYLSYRKIETADGKKRRCGSITAVHVEQVENYSNEE